MKSEQYISFVVREVDAIVPGIADANGRSFTSVCCCCRLQGKHFHADWTDMGEEMAHVRGAVVVRRPDLIQLPGMLEPASNLDFVKTLQSYFAIFKSSLFPIRYGTGTTIELTRTE